MKNIEALNRRLEELREKAYIDIDEDILIENGLNDDDKKEYQLIIDSLVEEVSK